MKRRILAACMLIVMAIPTMARQREVHILAVNDMHATIGLFPQLAAIADSLRTLYPDLLVFSAGDNRTGNPFNDKYEPSSYPIVALMNQVGFNGSTLGNHDFDVCSLPPLIGLSRFRYICANIFPSPESGINVVPCQVFDAGGLKVGVIGVVQVNPQNGIPNTHPENLTGVTFEQARDVVPRYEWVSRECDVTILLSHLGYSEDIKMAKRFPWLDLIIGGHTHTQLKPGEMHNGILITQNKNKLPYCTHITMTVDDGHVVGKEAEYIDIPHFASRNALVEQMVRQFSSSPFFQRVVARAETPFNSVNEIAEIVCDAFMEESHADIAIQNRGGVRLDRLPAGDITVLDVLEIDPFVNVAVEMKLTGQQVWQLINEYSQNNFYRFPNFAGITCEVTLDKADTLKIRKFKLFTPDGRPLNPNKTYHVIINSYVAATCKKTLENVKTTYTNIFTSDIIMRYLERHGTITNHNTPRIIIR